MKKLLLFSLSLAMLSVVSGCSSTTQRFDDKDLHFKLLSHQSMNGEDIYTIRISSTSSLKLTHLTMDLTYPIKTTTGSKWNPFAVAGKTSEQLVNLKRGQSTQFTFDAPIKEVFGDSKRLDFKNPEIKLEGYVHEANKDTPFQMSGNLSIFLSEYQWVT